MRDLRLETSMLSTGRVELVATHEAHLDVLVVLGRSQHELVLVAHPRHVSRILVILKRGASHLYPVRAIESTTSLHADGAGAQSRSDAAAGRLELAQAGLADRAHRVSASGGGMARA